MESKLNKILAECFTEKNHIKKMNYQGVFLLKAYEIVADYVEEFEVRDEDIWMCSFPKTGSTWTQEMIWNIANDLNFDGSKVPLHKRFSFLGVTVTSICGLVATKKTEEHFINSIKDSVKNIANLPSPRYIRTHLPFHLLPRQIRSGEKNNKIIYIARNPKDTCISYYHHYKLFEMYRGSFEDFCKLFLGAKVYYAPFWEHVIGFWKMRDKKNILCLKYEDMQADLPSVIKKTADFLGKNLTDEQIIQLQKHLAFSSMKKNSAVNLVPEIEIINKTQTLGKNFVAEGEFIRKGISGEWKNVMTKELIKEFEDWTAEKLKDFPILHEEFH